MRQSDIGRQEEQVEESTFKVVAVKDVCCVAVSAVVKNTVVKNLSRKYN